MGETSEPIGDLTRQVMVGRLPAPFARYDQRPEQMPAGAPGKLGLLRLRFAAQDGRTRLLPHYASGPQRVQRALYLDPGLPSMAFVFIQSVSGGILQGDRLAVDVTAGAGAQAHVTTQSATKLYRMERNYATQRVHLRVESGAYLEYLPDYVIPYRNARFYHEIEVEVADDSTLLVSDSVAPGRVASGETFAYDLLFTRMRAWDLLQRLRFTDTTLLEPMRHDPRRLGLLGPHTDLGTLYVLSGRVAAADLEAPLHECIQGLEGVDGGASRLPGEDGVVVRVTGDGSRAVQAALHRAWRISRNLIVGVDVPTVHTIKYGHEPAVDCKASAQTGETQ